MDALLLNTHQWHHRDTRIGLDCFVSSLGSVLKHCIVCNRTLLLAFTFSCYYFVCMHVSTGAHMAQHVCASQRVTLWYQFSRYYVGSTGHSGGQAFSAESCRCSRVSLRWLLVFLITRFRVQCGCFEHLGRHRGTLHCFRSPCQRKCMLRNSHVLGEERTTWLKNSAENKS